MTTSEFICEAKHSQVFIRAQACGKPATHVYGPECEAQTGQLMYLCAHHAMQISIWKTAHPNDPVECPTHGRLGKVKDYLVLKEI
jgi:hypothetical protein